MAASPSTDLALYRLAEHLGHELRAAGWRLATAESCTAGWIAKALTDVAGSSDWFECGYVTYSNAAKMRDLGVAARTLAEHGAVSEAAVMEMAEGALRVADSDVSVAVSGIAGPDGGTLDKPVGTVWLAVATRTPRRTTCQMRLFEGDREQVRRQSVAQALGLVLRAVREASSGQGFSS